MGWNGFRHKFWPTENVHKFTDSDGNPKKMTEVDEAELVLQSDGKSHWIDHWHIVEGDGTMQLIFLMLPSLSGKSEWGVGITAGAVNGYDI